MKTPALTRADFQAESERREASECWQRGQRVAEELFGERVPEPGDVVFVVKLTAEPRPDKWGHSPTQRFRDAMKWIERHFGLTSELTGGSSS